MGGGFQFIDIILIAMVAAFFVLRLRSVLGRRDGHDGSGHRDPFKPVAPEETKDGKVVPLPDRRHEDDVRPKADADAFAAEGTVDNGLVQIRVADPDFAPDEFLAGARVAFEMVLDAFASGDTKALRTLLDEGVYGDFEKAIRDREEQGLTVEDTLVGIKSADIVEAYMEGRVANITVKFVTEQVNVTRDAEGQVAEGNPNEVISVTDFWTFARDTKARDPNWALVATHSAD
ncbi:MAG: translocase [Rhodospirillales bacterium CG15_BIG_FIL_POST_REV_8_21_14_020_66_15]|nr:MAG: translocase [Rhodospirillales bacterium CG15_BIG_FIL_POST_REV_8_21_14_020_66_15]